MQQKQAQVRPPQAKMVSNASANTYTIPTSLHSPSSNPAQPAARKSWRQHVNFLSLKSQPSSGSGALDEQHVLRDEQNVLQDEQHELRQLNTNSTARSHHLPKWWKVRLFRGMINDVRRRAPYYGSDWTDAWDYRVVPATVYMYFAKYFFPPISNPRN